MKKTINCILVSILFLIALGSCNKEDVSTNIYSPNNLIVSESMADLTATIADAIEIKQGDLSIKSISFLDVKEGFIAEVETYISTTNEYTKVYYMSPLLKDNITYDDSVELAKVRAKNRSTVPVIDDGLTAFCSCGNSSTPSNGCRISGRLNEDFTITLRCFQTSCSSYCTLHPG